MKHPVVRIAAVVFAASLMSAFVVFKSGACAKNRPAMPASRVFFPGTMPATAPADRTLFPGSKSGRVVEPDSNLQPVLSGSKSLAPIFRPESSRPATDPSTQPE